MELVSTLTAGKSLLELGKEIAKIVNRAKDSPGVVQRVLLYLDAAQAAIHALGIERQRILTDVRKCDVSVVDQVNTLWSRLDRYLHEDNIRPELVNAISGLRACRYAIEKEAKGLWWRKGDKDAAVKEFINTLDELDNVLQGLTSNFYPGGSGMGVQTLVPLFELISRVRDSVRISRPINSDMIHEELGALTLEAIRDDTHQEWIRTGGKVEALVAQLHLAFSVKVAEAINRGT